MKAITDNQRTSRAGSALVVAVVLLAVASFTMGSTIVVIMSYARQGERALNREKAMFLADAGLRAALVKLNESNEGTISLNQSKQYFSNKAVFSQAAVWGFETRLQVVGGTNVLVSVGRYESLRQQVKMAVRLGSGSRSVHALYAHAVFAGNEGGDNNYVFEVGGTGFYADFIRGDVYSGNDISLSGTSYLRLPELLHEEVFDGVWDPLTEKWNDAYTTQDFTNAMTLAQFNAYKASMAPHMGKVYNNGVYDYGEAFADSMGNGVYDEGEAFTDSNGNGVRDAGDGYVDNNSNGIYDEGVDTIVDNGNGVYDEGEEWTDDPGRSKRQNGRYDPAGGFWKWIKKKNKWVWRSRPNWPAEQFEDSGNDHFDPGEPWYDGNGIYDPGEDFVDDRNGTYDYGTQAAGTISGMPSPADGQSAATGGDAAISPPDLASMYYHVSKDDQEPYGALSRWGHDVAVTAADYGGRPAITDSSRPEHIFLRNPSTSGSEYVGGKRIRGRGYSKVYDDAGNRIDDYFLEDPTDPTYNSRDNSASIDGTSYTAPMYVDVKDDQNSKVYYVDGNVYIHSPTAYSMRFRRPGTRITIVAKGNITISDEFYYNADYDENLEREDLDSTIVDNPSDALCFIALKNPDCSDSGNVYIGDAVYGTGGSIHSMLYAENNFIDNNINTSGQPFISIFGNMTAGNQVQLGRPASGSRTRLDVTLDERVKDGSIVIPGLPHPAGGERSIQLDTAWHLLPGTWESWSAIQ